MRVLAIEPWLGGSHERFLDGWKAHSSHTVEILGLPTRAWKWRMAAGAYPLATRAAQRERPDAFLASDYLDVARFKGFLPPEWADIPVILYFHENQLTYPQHPDRPALERDLTYGMTNVQSCLAADLVVFNSTYHRDDFKRAARRFLASLPAPRSIEALAAALQNARVIPPGVALDELPRGEGPAPDAALRIAFNHRWEHDKDPRAFLKSVAAAHARGANIELVLLGESFSTLPPGVDELLRVLSGLIRHRGFAEDRAHYAELLGSCDLVVSTAQHEFFGMSVLEGMATGCRPLLPARLSYPELLPPSEHATSLYRSDEELSERLLAAAQDPRALRDPEQRSATRRLVERFDVAHTARALDDACQSQYEGAGS